MDVKLLLDEFSIIERKAVLQSFAERIKAGESQMKVTYTVPMPYHTPTAAQVEVLPFVQNGSPH